jgi:hypothetical protein
MSVREPHAELVLRTLDARVEDHDGDLVLVLDDGAVSVHLEQGAGGHFEDALAGIDRLIIAAGRLDERLRGIRECLTSRTAARSAAMPPWAQKPTAAMSAVRRA